MPRYASSGTSITAVQSSRSIATGTPTSSSVSRMAVCSNDSPPSVRPDGNSQRVSPDLSRRIIKTRPPLTTRTPAPTNDCHIANTATLPTVSLLTFLSAYNVQGASDSDMENKRGETIFADDMQNQDAIAVALHLWYGIPEHRSVLTASPDRGSRMSEGRRESRHIGDH